MFGYLVEDVGFRVQDVSYPYASLLCDELVPGPRQLHIFMAYDLKFNVDSKNCVVGLLEVRVSNHMLVDPGFRVSAVDGAMKVVGFWGSRG